jgi:hypothetical protein
VLRQEDIAAIITLESVIKNTKDVHIVSQLVSVPAGQCGEVSLYATSDNTITGLSRNTPLDAIIVGCICYFFELNRSINSKWAIFGLCHYCIQ